MPTRPWTVLRPSPLTQRARNVWTVDDDIPGLAGVSRRMTIVRRDEGLIFFNAIPVPDETLAAIRALGTPRSLVLPNRYHALDAGSFAEKLSVQTFAPAVALAPLADRVVCRPIAELESDAQVRVISVDGFKTNEVALLHDETLIVGDVITNAPHASGLNGLMMRLVGFTGPAPTLPLPVRLRVGRDLKAVRRLLLELAKTPALTRLIPSHGDVLEHGVPAALEAVAHRL